MVAHDISRFQSHSQPESRSLKLLHASRDVSCYSARTHPDTYVATVSPRNPRFWFPTSQDSNHTRNPSHARSSDGTRPETYARYNDRTRPETYIATVPPCNSRWWLPTSQDSNHYRNPSRARYTDHTCPEPYVAIVSARVPMRIVLQCRHKTRDGGS
ncbi:hypothetical protein VitviT2T_007680 [Vitis vinifera]|uniref:Uncharacterized protein n=1 Tax=Vitis vinifera TaxID=29760 RepID=A0ABY9BZZ2_VITVI|nr:hypothetical protein VitviT2T_007680 [Vitis vinifera]